MINENRDCAYMDGTFCLRLCHDIGNGYALESHCGKCRHYRRRA